MQPTFQPDLSAMTCLCSSALALVVLPSVGRLASQFLVRFMQIDRKPASGLKRAVNSV